MIAGTCDEKMGGWKVGKGVGGAYGVRHPHPGFPPSEMPKRPDLV